jgi:hypothetical protein
MNLMTCKYILRGVNKISINMETNYDTINKLILEFLNKELKDLNITPEELINEISIKLENDELDSSESESFYELLGMLNVIYSI